MEIEAKPNCVACGKQLTIRAREMVPGTSTKCPHCGAKITFSGDDGRKVQGAVDDLMKTLKRMGAKRR